ncbi:MAG: hypothetical protein QM496_13095 [Verrucomicrobiota bacterium]
MNNPITMEYRQEQISSLIEALDDLIAVLELDPSGHWAKHFLTTRSQARSLSGAMSQDKFHRYVYLAGHPHNQSNNPHKL